MSGLVTSSHAVQRKTEERGGKNSVILSNEDTFALTLNYKGKALDEFWIKKSIMSPWTSGLSSIMTLVSVT